MLLSIQQDMGHKMGRKIISNLKFQKPLDDGFDANQFAEMVQEAYLDVPAKDSFIQKKTFSPSTIGYGHGNCPRYWFIAFSGAEFEEQFDAMARANMDNGTAVHDRVQKVISRTSVFKQHEIEITSDNPPIRGYADTIIEWNGQEVIGEIKSAKDEVFSIRQAEMKPTGNHMLQLLTYMKIRGAKQGFFYYENKNDQSYLILPINMNERNEKIIDDVFDWLKQVYANYEAGTLPERVFTKSVSACKYCPVKKVCWKEMDEGEVFIPAMVPPK
jgi:CRISPR/Cas system-associated exonuclease Cas4 (RecB family)